MATAGDNQLEELSEFLATNRKLPPVHEWNPSHTDDIDIRIARNGDWFYRGSLIQRQRMVNLFSTVLRVDDDGHTYLVTPQQRLRIQVEDAPFTAVLMDVTGSAQSQLLMFTTNTGDRVVAGNSNPVFIEYANGSDEPSPYVIVRKRLRALISRSVFIQLAELLTEHEGKAGVFSDGTFMPLAFS